ncbi:MAG: RpiB/LacA/LacB family sugar-phosphate isomerase, partial [Lachnospiraceae bacterium]|nr:RpiB/LacA/LacB family sugar-phosphate isomerase [Lachnospiraceae bacterium]
MKIGVIQASSQAEKNELIYDTVSKYAPEGAEVINFGCTKDEKDRYSYIDISVLVGALLVSGSVDFVVTGCSSGQGMMLACNSMPGVICGYAPTPMDAYLFAQINDGNAISLPLGEEYTWSGYDNFEKTIEKLLRAVSEAWL